jgi:hypothetical protein
VMQIIDNTASASSSHAILSTNGDFVFLGSKNTSGSASSAVVFHNYVPTRPTLDQTPFCLFAYYVAGGVLITIYFGSPSYTTMRSHTNVSTLTAGFIYPYMGSYALGNLSAAGDAIDLKADDYPVMVITTGTVSLRGRLADIYWAPSALAQGTSEPNPGPPVAAIVGHLWLPANVGPVF